jgi:hypothetical protein
MPAAHALGKGEACEASPTFVNRFAAQFTDRLEKITGVLAAVFKLAEIVEFGTFAASRFDPQKNGIF